MRSKYSATATPTATGLTPTQNTPRQARCMPTNGTMRAQSTRSRDRSLGRVRRRAGVEPARSARQGCPSAALRGSRAAMPCPWPRPQFAAVSPAASPPPSSRTRRSLTTLRGSSQIGEERRSEGRVVDLARTGRAGRRNASVRRAPRPSSRSARAPRPTRRCAARPASARAGVGIGVAEPAPGGVGDFEQLVARERAPVPEAQRHGLARRRSPL